MYSSSVYFDQAQDNLNLIPLSMLCHMMSRPIPGPRLKLECDMIFYIHLEDLLVIEVLLFNESDWFAYRTASSIIFRSYAHTKHIGKAILALTWYFG